MSYLNKGIDFIIKISKVLMVILMAVMVISMFLQVVTRYAMGTGLPWTEELARFANVWLIFIGSSVLAFADGHIKVTIFDSILKDKSLAALLTVRKLIFIIYSFAVIKVGLQTLTIVASQTSPNMLLPMNYIYIVIPLGAVLTVIYLLISFFIKREEVNNG